MSGIPAIGLYNSVTDRQFLGTTLVVGTTLISQDI